MYVWGHNNVNNRLGVAPDMAERAAREPQAMTSLQRVIARAKDENNMGGPGAKGGMGQDDSLDNQQK